MGTKNKPKKRVNFQSLGFKTHQEYMVAKKNGNLDEEIDRLKKEEEMRINNKGRTDAPS